jgi:hypothetical protein
MSHEMHPETAAEAAVIDQEAAPIGPPKVADTPAEEAPAPAARPQHAAPTLRDRSEDAAPMPKARRKLDGRTREAKALAAYRQEFAGILGAPDLPYARMPPLLRIAVDQAVSLRMAFDAILAAQAAGSTAISPDDVVRVSNALLRALEALNNHAAQAEARSEARRWAREEARLGLPPRTSP